MLLRVGRDADVVGDLIRGNESTRSIELFNGANFRQQYAFEDIVTPLLVGSLKGRLFGAIVRKLNFEQHRFALAAAPSKCLNDLPKLFGWARGRDQTIGPTAHPFGGGWRDGSANDFGHVVGAAVEGRIFDLHQTVVVHRFPGPQRSDDFDTFMQAGVAIALARPVRSGNVLVQGLPAAYRQPKAMRKHLHQGSGGLGNDRGTIALTRGIHHPKVQVGGLHRCTQPRPGKAALALIFSPGMEVVGRQGMGKACLFRFLGQLQELARGELFVGDVVSEVGHGGVDGSVGWVR